MERRSEITQKPERYDWRFFSWLHGFLLNSSVTRLSAAPLKQAVDEGRGGGPTQRDHEAEQKQRGQQRDQPEFFVLFQEQKKFSDDARWRPPSRLLECA